MTAQADPVAQRARVRVDCEISKLYANLDEFELPLTLENASLFVRAAYGCGYTSALRLGPDDEPLTEKVPMLAHPELFLP